MPTPLGPAKNTFSFLPTKLHVAAQPLRDLCLAVGVVGEVKLGALLACRISYRWIVLRLAIALGLVGVRMIVAAI